MVPRWLLGVFVPCRLSLGVCLGTQWVLSFICSLPRRVVGELGEVYHIAGSTGLISRHGLWCRGSSWRYIGKFCIFLCRI